MVAYDVLRVLIPDATRNRGLLYNKLRDWENAIKDFDTALELNGDDFEAYMQRGLAKVSLLRKDAIDDLLNSLRLNKFQPLLIHIMTSLALPALKAGDLAYTQIYFSEIAQATDNDPNTYFEIAEELMRNGFIADAASFYEAARQLGHNQADEKLNEAMRQIRDLPHEKIDEVFGIAPSYRDWHPEADRFLDQAYSKFDASLFSIKELDEALILVSKLNRTASILKQRSSYPIIKTEKFMSVLEDLLDEVSDEMIETHLVLVMVILERLD